jgi:outer membrane protein assembly factor BamB
MANQPDPSEDRPLLIVGLSGQVFGVDPATGTRVWEHEVNGKGGLVEIVVHAGRVYALATNHLHCIDYRSGRLIGKVEIPSSPGGRPIMLLEGERLFVATWGELFAFSLDGRLLWQDGYKGNAKGSMSLAFPDNARQADAQGTR